MPMLSLDMTEAKLMELSNAEFFDPEELCKNTRSYAECVACSFENPLEGTSQDSLFIDCFEGWLLNGIQPGNDNRTIRAMLDDYIDSIYSRKGQYRLCSNKHIHL